ncbi:hypothetical protein LB505_001285 [Fusarium chuoi]|nr:hypothetical protein LB505_001285 [Fusarium chuoi]
MRACLELHGITNARAPVDRPPPEAQPNGQPADVPNLPQGWSALETLAEASRQVDLNENNRAQSVQAGVVDPADPANAQHVQFSNHSQEPSYHPRSDFKHCFLIALLPQTSRTYRSPLLLQPG